MRYPLVCVRISSFTAWVGVSPSPVSLDWLLTGKGEKRPTGMLPGSLLANVIMVDQYQPGTSLNMQMIVGQIPFSRPFLENKLGLEEPMRETLLAIEASQICAALNEAIWCWSTASKAV
jgi:hypothetical protein